MVWNGFTEKANEALSEALRLASHLGHGYIGSEHILYGLCTTNASAAYSLLKQNGISENAVAERLMKVSGKKGASLSAGDLTPRSKRILENAIVLAKTAGKRLAGTEHLLRAIAADPECYACVLLRELGMDMYSIYIDKKRPDDKKHKRGQLSQLLQKYGKDLTERAEQGLLDPCLCREKETDRVIEILLRRMKNNPCLVGEPGVGKTAVAEGLAQRIISQNVPYDLKNKRIYMLDLSLLLSGAKYRGDFEERLSSVLSEISQSEDIILFIDEIHNIIGAGAAEGAIDAANIMKPMLARGEIHLIGATTCAEYKRFIEKDPALERRLQPVEVNEPSEQDALFILRGLKEKYEQHHGIAISDAALESAVALSKRYIHDRYLPDKALDIIDESASALRLSGGDVLQKQDICKTVSDITGIPLGKIEQGQAHKLAFLEDELRKSVIGQDAAIKSVAEAVRRNRAGLSLGGRPIGSFIFVGEGGVGKTHCCKAVAYSVFGSEKAMIRLDMSEYTEPHSVSKLIGAPIGYAGHDEGGQLTEAVRKKPYSVVVFDEIEKAHHDIYDLLLQILEEGTLTDSSGRKTDFSNTVVILTGNIAADMLSKKKLPMGFYKSENDENVRIKEELTKVFSPELLGRIDEIVPFRPLELDDMRSICGIMLDDLADRCERIGLNFSRTKALEENICRLAMNESGGARPLRRLIAEQVENKLSMGLIKGEFSPSERVTADYSEEHGGTVLVRSADTVIFQPSLTQTS